MAYQYGGLGYEIFGIRVKKNDRGYDDEKLVTRLWDEYQIKPVIDIRNHWKDGEKTRLLKEHNNVVYDYRGNVYCYCPKTGKHRSMAYGGFEKDRKH